MEINLVKNCVHGQDCDFYRLPPFNFESTRKVSQTLYFLYLAADKTHFKIPGLKLLVLLLKNGKAEIC